MNAKEYFPEASPQPEIVLICIKQERYYLVQGEDYVQELLQLGGNFPRPVRCMHFDSLLSLHAFVGRDFSLSDYFGINPKIIDRLRNDGDLVDDWEDTSETGATL